jgi:multidrug resistance efflux pump
MAALLEAQHDVRRAMQSVQSSRRLDEQQQEQQEQHLAEAEARVKKLWLLVQGPSIPQVPLSPPESEGAAHNW